MNKNTSIFNLFDNYQTYTILRFIKMLCSLLRNIILLRFHNNYSISKTSLILFYERLHNSCFNMVNNYNLHMDEKQCSFHQKVLIFWTKLKQWKGDVSFNFLDKNISAQKKMFNNMFWNRYILNSTTLIIFIFRWWKTVLKF